MVGSMKKNPYIVVLICTLFIIFVEFFVSNIIVKTTRLYPKTEIILQLESDKLEGYELPLNISEKSLTQL